MYMTLLIHLAWKIDCFALSGSDEYAYLFRRRRDRNVNSMNDNPAEEQFVKRCRNRSYNEMLRLEARAHYDFKSCII